MDLMQSSLELLYVFFFFSLRSMRIEDGFYYESAHSLVNYHHAAQLKRFANCSANCIIT